VTVIRVRRAKDGGFSPEAAVDPDLDARAPLAGRSPMNKPVTAADLVTPKVTTGPLPASRKVHAAPEAAPDLRVPLREIVLDASSGEPPLPVYDTTGVYSD